MSNNDHNNQSNRSGKTMRQRSQSESGDSDNSSNKKRKVPDWLKTVMMGCWVIVVLFLFMFLTGWWELRIEHGKVAKDIWDSTIPTAVLCIGVFGAILQVMIFSYYEDR